MLTRERYERVVRRHVLGSTDPQRRPLGEMKLRDVTPDRVAEWSQCNEKRLASSTAQLGHSSLATTSRYLAHIAPAELVKAMQARTWTL